MSPGPSSAPGASKLFLGTLPDDVDFAALTTLLPDISLESVSAENVIACFRVILTQMDQFDAKDKEIDDLKAQTEREEVEFDQALQDRESSIKDLEASNESLQAELGRVQKENGELGAWHCCSIFPSVAHAFVQPPPAIRCKRNYHSSVQTTRRPPSSWMDYEGGQRMSNERSVTCWVWWPGWRRTRLRVGKKSYNFARQ